MIVIGRTPDGEDIRREDGVSLTRMRELVTDWAAAGLVVEVLQESSEKVWTSE